MLVGRVGPSEHPRHRHLEHVPLPQEFQLVEEVARPAVLRVGDYPVELDLAEPPMFRTSSAAICGLVRNSRPSGI